MFGFVNFAAGPHALLLQLAVVLPVFLVSITFHEFAHAAAASALGDPTPGRAGRVTLNPLAHLDVLGTFMILFGPIGWAKPVPIDERYLGRWGTVLVSLAGPLANFGLAVAALWILKHAVAPIRPLELAFDLNLALAVFNLLPIPPLDGSQLVRGLLPPRWRPGYYHLLPYGIVILLALVWLPGGGALIGHVIGTVARWLDRLVP